MNSFKEEFARDVYSYSANQQNGISLFKLTLYTFFGNILRSQPVNIPIYLVLVFIECATLTYYPVVILEESLDFAFNFFEKSSYPYLFIATCSVIGIYTITTFLLLIILYCNINFAQSRQLQSGSSYASINTTSDGNMCCYKIYGFLLLVYQYVLMLPMLWICLIPVASSTENGFASNIAVSIVGLIFAAIAIVLQLIIIIFFYDEELDSKLPWTLTSIIKNCLELLRKIVISFAFSYSRSQSFSGQMLTMGCLIHAIELIYTIKAQGTLNKILESSVNLFEMSSFIFHLLVLINSIFDDLLIDYPALFVIILLVAEMIITLAKTKNRLYIMSNRNSTENSEKYVREIVYMLKQEVDGKNHASSLVSFIKCHRTICIESECPCKEIELIDRDIPEGQPLISQTNVPGIDKEDKNKFKRSVYIFLNFLVKNRCSESRNCAKFYILSAEIQLKYLLNEFQAVYELQEAQDCSPSLQDEYFIFRLRNMVEGKIVEGNLKGSSGDNLAIDQWISFYEKFIQFQDRIMTTTGYYISFWEELLKDIPNYSELTGISYKIALNLDKIQFTFKEITKILQNNVKSYVMYTLFLYKVTKDMYLSQEIYNETKAVLDSYYANRKRWEANEGKFGENTTSAIIIMSGNKATVGTVLNANNELWEILGYEKNCVIGKNVSMLMPELLGSHHNRFVQNSFNKSVSTALTTKQFLILVQHSLGWVIPCNLFTKLIPNLSKGIQFIGFLSIAKTVDSFRQGETQVSPNSLLLFLLDKTMYLEGFNKLFLNVLGRKFSSIEMQRYVENDKKIDLPKHFPTIFTVKNEAIFESEEGFTTTINFAGLIKEFRENAASEIEIDAAEANNLEFTTNIKMKKYTYLKGDLVYYICTLTLDDAKARALFVPQSESNSNNILFDNKQFKDEILDYHEDASVSNTNSSVSQLSYGIQSIKGFRGKMRSTNDPCLIQCFRLSSFAILVVFITVYSVIYYLNSKLILSFKTSSKLIFLKYMRVNYNLLIVYDIRTLHNIYFGLQDDESEALSKRADYYFQDLAFYANKILQTQEEITTVQKGYVFDNLVSKYNMGDHLELKEVISWNDNVLVYSNNTFKCSLEIGIRQIVSKITDIIGVSREQYHAKTLSEEVLSTWNRLMAYVLFNSLHVLLPNQQEASTEILEIVLAKGIRDKRIFVIILIVLIASSGIALFAPIPFVFKSHSESMAVVSIFIRLPKEDIKEIINSSQEYKKGMNDNLGDMLKSFNDINFQLDSDAEKQILIDKRNKKEQDNIPEEGTEEEIAKEKVIELDVKRKLNFISISNTGFRNCLIIESVIILVIFAIFYTVSLILRTTYFNRMKDLLEALDRVTYTTPLTTYVLVAGLENFSERKALHVDFWKTRKSELRRNLDIFAENAMHREYLERELSTNFKEIAEIKDKLNSENMCNMGKYYPDIRKSCNLIYNKVLNYGFENYVSQVALEMEILYNHFLTAVEDGNDKYLRSLVNLTSFISISEANSIFISSIMYAYLTDIYSIGNDIIHKTQTYDTIDLVVFILLIIITILLVFNLFLSRFKNSILKVKRMLLILPTKLIAQDLNNVRQILNSVS